MPHHGKILAGLAAVRMSFRKGWDGGMDRRVIAVLVYDDVRAAPDVEVRDHSRCIRLKAASESEVVMSGRA